MICRVEVARHDMFLLHKHFAVLKVAACQHGRIRKHRVRECLERRDEQKRCKKWVTGLRRVGVKCLVSLSRSSKSTVELHISGLIGTARHPDKQEIRIIGFLFENRLHWQFEALLLLLQYVPASKPFDHA